MNSELGVHVCQCVLNVQDVQVALWWETQSSFTNLGVRAAVCLCFLVAGWVSPVHSLPEVL